MRYYKVNSETVDDLAFETEHSTLFNLKAHITADAKIKAYNPHQKEVFIPIRPKKDGNGFYITLQPQFRIQVPTGLAFSIPVKFQLRVTPNKTLSLKSGVVMLDGMEIYDNDFTDELTVTLMNTSDTPVYIFSNEIIAQATLNKVLEYTLEETSRKVAVKNYDKSDVVENTNEDE